MKSSEPTTNQVTGAVVEKYLEINVIGIESVDSTRATIEFELSDSWLVENNIEIASVRLFRFHEQWTTLTTEHIGSTSDTQLFRASTPGFSLFAIGSLTEPAVSNLEPTEAVAPEDLENQLNVTSTPTSPTPIPTAPVN